MEKFTGLGFTTYQLSIKFKDEANQNELQAFAQKYGLQHLNTTLYQSHLFRISDWVRTVQTGNYIHENEAAEWSSPNFGSIVQTH